MKPKPAAAAANGADGDADAARAKYEGMKKFKLKVELKKLGLPQVSLALASFTRLGFAQFGTRGCVTDSDRDPDRILKTLIVVAIQAGDEAAMVQRLVDAAVLGVDAVKAREAEAAAAAASADAAAASDGPSADEYASMPPFKLRNELKTQGLSTDGSADEMRARLVAAGKKAPPPVGAKKTGAWPSTLRIPSGCPPPHTGQHTHCKV